MSVYNTVSDLYADVQKYLNRNESSIVSKIPAWVHMAEDELDRRLRHPASIVHSVYTVENGFDVIPVPESLLELKSIGIKGSGELLSRRSVDTLYHRPFPERNIPTAFAARGNRFLLNTSVAENTTFEVSYYTSPEKLSVTNPTNLYLYSLGDYLLYVALSNAFAYDTNFEESQFYRQQAEMALSTLIDQIEREEIAGSTLVTFANSDYFDYYY